MVNFRIAISSNLFNFLAISISTTHVLNTHLKIQTINPTYELRLHIREVRFTFYLQFYSLTHAVENIGSIDNVASCRTYDSQWIPSVYIYKELDRRGEGWGGFDAPEHVVLIVVRACQRAPAHSRLTKSGNENSRAIFGFNDRSCAWSNSFIYW